VKSAGVDPAFFFVVLEQLRPSAFFFLVLGLLRPAARERAS